MQIEYIWLILAPILLSFLFNNKNNSIWSMIGSGITFGSIVIAIISSDLITFSICIVAAVLSWPVLKLIHLNGTDKIQRNILEGTTKHLFHNFLASTIFSLGIALILLNSDSLSISAITLTLNQQSISLSGLLGAIATVGSALALIGMIPFHLYSADTAEAANENGHLPLTINFTIAFLIMYKLFPWGCLWQKVDLHNAISTLLILSVFLGPMIACVQARIIRLLTWLVIGEISFIFLLIIQFRPIGYHDSMNAGILMLFSSMAGLGIFFQICNKIGIFSKPAPVLADITGMWKKSNIQVIIAIYALVWLCNLPGSPGWLGKWTMLKTMINQTDYWLIISFGSIPIQILNINYVFKYMRTGQEPSINSLKINLIIIIMMLATTSIFYFSNHLI